MLKKQVFILILATIALLVGAQDAFALYYYGGNGDGFDVAMGANADVVTISSAADQTFLTTDSTTAISTITITQDVGLTGGGINTTNDIRVKIPTALDMTWDTTDTTATISGSASAKVSTTVSYEDSGKTLVIDVTTNFANGDYITVNGLSFKSFNSVGFDNLELEIDNLGNTAATDPYKKTISLPASSATFTGGSGDGFAIDSNIRYWVASVDGNWNDTANWSDTSGGTSGFSVPGSGQVAVFDSGSTKQCTVNVATVSILDLIITSGYTGASAKLDTNGNDISVSANLTISGGELELDASSDLAVSGTLTVSGGTLDGLNGTIDANGNVSISSGTLIAPLGAFTVAGNWTKTGGTFTSGTGTVTFDAGSGTQQVTSGGVTDNDDFYNITHSGAGTLQQQDAMLVTHDLANSAGTWNANGKALTIYEDFSNTATFTHNNNTVTFRGTAQSDITGNNTFYNLTIDTNIDGAKTVRFGAGQIQTIATTLSITGYAGKVLTIRSTTDGTQATIDIPASITTGVDYVDVKDSKIDDANYTITAGSNSTDSGSNINWIFGSGVARAISGSLYQSNRTTKLTNQTVKLSVNGASAVQQTASAGDFTFSNIVLSSGDKILVWIDDDATYEGNTITVSDGATLTGLNIYAGHVSIRYETGSSITNANLSTAKGTLTDDDIKYSVSSGNLTVQDNFKFYIPATYTYAPGGTITVDDIEIDGTLNSSGNDVTVSGDWDNSSGSYTSGNNTTTFNGASKQTLTSGGTGDTKDFYNLTHSASAELELTASNALDVDGTLTQSGAGDLDTQGNDVTLGGLTISTGSFNNDARAGTWDINGNVSISSGTLKATSGSFTVSGNWNKTGGTFTHNSGTVTFDGTSTQTVTTGGSAFSTLAVTNALDYVTFNDATICANFTAQTASSKLKFKESVNFTVTGTLTLNGQAAGTEIELRSALDGTQWNLVAPATTVSYVKVKDSNSTNTITADHSIDLGNNTNWTFTAVTRYWLGTASANWNDSSNWSSTSGGTGGADAPSTGDTAIFDSNGNNPCTVNIATVSLAVLDIQAGYTSKLDANGNDITLTSNLTLSGGELELDTSSDLTVSGTLTVSGGTLDGLNGTIDANGAVTVSSGTLIAPGSGKSFTIAGSFNHSGGTFTHSSGTVTFDTTTTSTISGSTTFHNFTCTTAGKTLTFTDGTTQTINSVFTITGASGNLIKLQGSGVAGWTITDSGTESVYYADVTRSTATNSITAHNSFNRGNNTNWTFQVVDPYGVVFDSVSNNPIKGATVSLYTSSGALAGSTQLPNTAPGTPQVNPQTTGANGAYQWDAVPGNYYITVTASGYTYPSTRTSFPSGRTIVTGSKGETFTVATTALNIDLPLDSTTSLLKVTKDANKKEVVVGAVVTYTVTIQNETSSDVTNVYLEDKIPAGFKYISGKAILDNTPIADPTGNRPLTFNIGTVSAGTTKTLKYQLVVGSGVSFGNYENTAFAKYSDGTVISNNATETVKVVPDPLFELGTVIGKVFWDKNENGIQDPPTKIDGKDIIEEPIPNVQIATEEGTLITTDKDGKYHLPAIIPGRHILRVDERTLPEGAYLTTDKAVIVDITEGILAKVNFGVNSKDKEQKIEDRSQKTEMPVKIMQERTKPTPRLNIACYPQDSQYEFRIFTNYSLFIEKWKLEILDKDTKAVVKKLEGARLTINEPIFWDGKDKDGKLLKEDRNYVYVLTVTGKDGRQDVTKEKKLSVVSSQLSEATVREQKSEKEIEKEKQRWIEQESKLNNLDKQNIRIEGETVKVIGLSGYQDIRVKKGEKIEGEIPVVKKEGLTAKDLLENKSGKGRDEQSEVEIILPKGEYDVQVIPQDSEASKQGLSPSSLGSVPFGDRPFSSKGTVPDVYTKHLKIGEDYLLFVGMGDAKAGYTFNRGNIEPVQQDDKFNKGFWSEGKMAYYLKGKIKGKYLITSSLDTERDKKELFRNLDPDKYYPVYGDSSSINYDATNTQGPLYLLVEWDKSSAIWGNYNTAFTDTEFATFSRTLYGGKAHLESVSATQFGEPHTKLVVFRARAQQRAAHNEFIGTGGSLFYLKNKDVIEGSDKVKIEVRDKITGLVLATKEMEGRVDYQINYSEGRLIFWKPVSQISESDSIISSQLLDGNPVYVVVDYEYETKDKYDEGNYGLRAQQSLTDYLRVGGTYVREEQLDKNYILKGTDTVIHLGKDIKLTGEYAESESESLGSFISTDGGLSFTELATGDLDKGKAYGIKGEAHLLGRLGLTSYYKQIEKGFSSAATTSEQGKELMGAGATFDITPKTRLKVSHDIQKLIDDGNLQAQLQVGAKKTETTSVQLGHEVVTDKLKLTGEYRKQQVKEKKEQFESETNTETDIVAVKADYQATKKTALSLEQQATLKGTPNHQTTAGINVKVNEKVSLRAKETVGIQGTATNLGVTVYPARDKDSKGTNIKDSLELSTDYTRANYKTGRVTDTVSLSGKARLDEKTQVHTTIAVTDSSEGGQTQSLVFGSERKLNEGLKLVSTKTYAKSRDNLIQANTYGLTKEKDGKKLEGTFTEQKSKSNTEVSNTNIFGLSGDINDKWAALVSFERGTVQNLDGTQATRNAGSVGLGYVDKDSKTGEVKLKASSKLELRLDDGQQDKRQFLIYNAVEGKINPNTTLFAKANISQTKNTTTQSTEAEYRELVTGVAYRPVNFDRLNLLGRYTYLEDNSPSGQTDFKNIEKEKSHTIAGEAVYDLTNRWQLVEKLAYKMGEEKVSGFDFTKTQTWLMVHRLNYNFGRDWQVGAEYRRLTQKQAKDYKQGALVEVARKVGEFVQVGLGYNFTNFNDDLTHLDYTAQGPFVRLTAKFYDRTPEDIERVRQKWLEQMIKFWTWELVNEELAKPDSAIIQELCKYFYLAEKLRTQGRLKESKELYEKILQIGSIMYQEAEAYIRNRIELEKSIKEKNRLALAYYKEGKLQEAKTLWEKILKEAEPKPITLEVIK